MIPIAHRGFWWPDRRGQNWGPAIQHAIDAGYGVELDVRLSEQHTLYLAHDLSDAGMLLDQPGLITTLRRAPVILWDIKEVRAIPPLAAWLWQHNLCGNAVCFDIEIAEQVAGRSWHDVWVDGPYYLRRASETESLFDALADERAAGVWLDAWNKEWVTADAIRTVQSIGKRAYVCSSELHQRAIRLDAWRQWAAADGVCTDFPHLLAAVEVDRDPALHPAGWHAEAHR